jgi:hypothetical protein
VVIEVFSILSCLLWRFAKVALDTDALNYPYIRIRNVEWLKRTLLVFPHVARIAPSYGAPEDKAEVAQFRNLNGRRGPLLRNVDLESADIWTDQFELKARISDALSANRSQFIKQFGREATLDDVDLLRESASVWHDRFASRTFQLHGQKVVADLLNLLFENGLAWNPQNAHGRGYVEMHPRLAEAVLATLALACAKNEGLSLVTEFPQIYGRTIHRSKEEIFQSCLDLAPNDKMVKHEPAPANLVDFVVHQRCDVSKLTPENLLALNKDWEAVGTFKDSLEKLAADIPPGIGSPTILHQHLREKADKMIERWKQDNKNLPQRLKDLLSGDGEEAAKALEKLIEKGIGGEVVGGTSGGLITWLSSGHLTYQAVLAATAGLAVAVVIHTGKNIAAMKKKQKEDPFRYLTMMHKAGVSYMASG